LGAEIQKAREPNESCGVELRVSDLQMNAWTWWVYDRYYDDVWTKNLLKTS